MEDPLRPEDHLGWIKLIVLIYSTIYIFIRVNFEKKI